MGEYGLNKFFCVYNYYVSFELRSSQVNFERGISEHEWKFVPAKLILILLRPLFKILIWFRVTLRLLN